jgi:hypothetical protein
VEKIHDKQLRSGFGNVMDQPLDEVLGEIAENHDIDVQERIAGLRTDLVRAGRGRFDRWHPLGPLDGSDAVQRMERARRGQSARGDESGVRRSAR